MRADRLGVLWVVACLHSGAMDAIRAEGYNGQVEFDGAFVTITRKGFVARATIGKGEKRIPVGSITAVQYKPPTALVRGFIAFTIAGGVEKQSRFGRQTTSAGHDENAVIVSNKHGSQFDRLRAAVENAIAAHHTPRPVMMQAAPSVADELAKLAGLMQQGILSPAEFEAQKARLLRQ